MWHDIGLWALFIGSVAFIARFQNLVPTKWNTSKGLFGGMTH